MPTVRRVGAAVAGAVLTLAIPAAASAECLGCDPPPTSLVDALAATILFTVVVTVAIVMAVTEARR